MDFVLPVDGTNPKVTTKQWLEAAINAALEALDAASRDELQAAIDDLDATLRAYTDSEIAAVEIGMGVSISDIFEAAESARVDAATASSSAAIATSQAGIAITAAEAAGAQYYANVATGQAATSAGEFFYVRESDSTRLYENVAGTATDRGVLSGVSVSAISQLAGIRGSFAGQVAKAGASTYIWVSDLTWDEIDTTNDVVKPTAIASASPGRWLRTVPAQTEPRLVYLPRFLAKSYNLSSESDFRVMIIGDSLTAKYTTQPGGALGTFETWMRRQFGGQSCTVLDQFQAVSGGTLGATRSVDDDANESLVGYHYALTAGTVYRLRDNGADPTATGVRIFYTREPGAGSFEVTLTAQTTAETTSVTVNANGTRQSAYVDLTLPGEVTGAWAGQKVFVNLEVTSGTVKFQPAHDTFDTTINAAKLHYHIGYARGGQLFEPDDWDANEAVFGKTIADYAPDLIVFECADPVNSTRLFIDRFFTDLTARGVNADFLFLSTTDVYDADVNPSLSNTVSINGSPVAQRTLTGNFFRAFTQDVPNSQFFDYGSVIRSQKIGRDIGALSSGDPIHPGGLGSAVFLAALTSAIATYEKVSGNSYLERSVARSRALGDYPGYDLADPSKVFAETYVSPGDYNAAFGRYMQWHYDNNGTPYLVMRLDSLGVEVRRLEFTQSNVVINSTVNGVLEFGNVRLSGILAGVASTDALTLGQMQGAATSAQLGSAANAINTSGKFGSKQVWNSTVKKQMRAEGGTATSDWEYMDGSGSITPV